MTPHKKEWKLNKASMIHKLKSKDKFLELLNQLDLMEFDDYMKAWEDIDSQVSMIASTVYEAENDK